jgi:hypothetical protein
MSAPAQKKRSAEEPAQPPAAKRPATRSQQDDEIIEVKDEPDYQVKIELDPKFNVFPDLLRAALQKSYVSTIKSQMRALATNTIPKHKFTYRVVSETVVHQSPHGPKRTILKVDLTSLSLSNTALLNIFLKSGKNNMVPKGKFVRLEQPGIANPKFSKLHFVRLGEIGWGSDATGCLSLHVPSIEKEEKREYNIYVERMAIKAEEKEN